MDSSFTNRSYAYRYAPCHSPTPHPQSYAGNPNFYGGSDQNVYLQNHHHYPRRHELPPPPPPPPPPPMVNQPSSFYIQQPQPPPFPPQHVGYKPQHFAYDSPRMSQPSSSFSCRDSRDIPQSAWVGSGETRPDSWVAAAGSGRNYQVIYDRLSRDYSGDKAGPGLDSNFRFRDEFSGLGYVRGGFGAGRIEENYQNRAQFRSESDRTSRVLGAGNRGSSSIFCYGNNQYGAVLDRHAIRSSSSDGGAGNHRWPVDSRAANEGRALFPQKYDDYYHSEIERYFDDGRRENGYELNRTPRKQMQKKSALLRLETPRPSQRGRENDRSRYPCRYIEKKSSLFRYKDQLGHSDRGFVQKQRLGTPMELDVSFESNALVAKAKVTPTRVGAGTDVCVTPRSGKVRRVLVTDKEDKASLSEVIAEGDIKTSVVDKGSDSDKGCRLSKNEASVSGVEKKSDSHSNPSSIVSEDQRKKDTSVEAVVSDCRVKIIDTDLKTSLDQAAAKAHSQVYFAEKVPCLIDEAPKESKDDIDGRDLSNPGENVVGQYLSSSEENVVDRDISIKKSHQDTVQDRESVSSGAGEIVLPKFLKKKKRIMKKMMKKVTRFPPSLLVSQPTDSENLSKNPDGSVPSAGMSSMRSFGSQTFIDEVSKNEEKDISSTHLLSKESNICFGGRNASTSPLGSSDHREKEFVKSSSEAIILSSSEDVADQMLSKSTMSNTSRIEDGGNAIHQKEGSLFPDKDSCGDCPKDLFSSERREKFCTPFLEANSLSDHLANADYLTVETNATTRFDSLDRSVAFGVERVNFAPSQAVQEGVGLSVESGCGKRSSESRPYSNGEESHDNLDSDAGKQACVNDVSISPKNVARKGSQHMFPEGRSDGDLLATNKNGETLSSELDLAKAISSDVCMEFASMDNRVHDQDVNLKSHGPGHFGSACLDPFIEGITVLDSGVRACFTESMALLGEDTNAGPGEALLERDVMEKAPSSCYKLSGSQGLIIDNSLATGGIDKSCSETIPESKCFSPGTPFAEGCKVLLENHLGCGSSDAMVSVRDSSVDDSLTKDDSRVSSCLVPDNSAAQCHLSSLLPVNEQMQNATSVQANCGESLVNVIDKESDGVEKLDTDSQEEKIKLSTETSKHRSPEIDVSTISGVSIIPCDSFSRPLQLRIGHMQTGTPVTGCGNESASAQAIEKEDQPLAAPQEQIRNLHEAAPPGSSLEHLPCSGQTSPGTDVESDENLGSNNFALPSYPVVGSSEKPNDDLMENPPDAPSDFGSPECSLNVADTDTLDGGVVRFMPCDEKVSGTSCLVSSGVPCFTSQADVKCAFSRAKDLLVSRAALVSNNETKAMKSVGEKPQAGANTFKYAGHKSYPRSPFLFAAKGNANPPTRITKPHTWHRKGDTSASPLAATKPLSSGFFTQPKLPKTTVETKGTYIRRGNSLLRKSAPSTVNGVSLGSHPSTDQLSRSAVDDDETLGSDQRTDANDTSIVVRMGETPTTERPSVLPSDSITKVSGSIASSSGKYTSSPRRDPLINGFPESSTDFVKSGEADVPLSDEDGLKTSVSVNWTGDALDCQRKGPPAYLASSNPWKISYVKRKSNQLVAASDIYSIGKNQIPSSDGYFKRRKNQLVRTSDSHAKPSVLSPNDTLNAQALAAPKIISKKKFTSTISDVAVMKPFKHSKFSLVWTLNDTQSRKTSRVHMQYQKILPQLFPWKRVTYWRRLMNSASVSRKSSFSTISQKLLLLRKRRTVYTRSNNGYSLRKSKVLSIGGSNLKWSKSIERNSKKANEEATLAVAAFAKRKRENHSGLVVTGTKSKSHPARERIFRIGSVRYKMDPSRRTLQRISDDESPYSGPPEPGKDAKKSFIPKRLVIGNDEYVRVGNGNQLVRDPKKRTRVLANEKVRWSLHNVRLRLAKKRKYCQFFTRFGKCNKDDGKCPYIHDPSKVAVCTKFLNGLCANPNCKLTHKVIPERMPDCSYFLQGLCNNEACPYRHVHVNTNAATCEGFLRGYCADGDECRKKHTYCCPVFEATGSCPRGTKCKLHHPKKRSKGRKRKRLCEPLRKNARGRYFGSLHNNLPESEPKLLYGNATESAVFGGEAPDFISLDVSEDEAGESHDAAAEQSFAGNSDALDLLEERIKPVGLMRQRRPTATAT